MTFAGTLLFFSIAGQIMAGVLLADFLSGVFHWFEDRYGNPKWPVLGHTITQNQLHHHTPRSFLTGKFLSRNKEVFAVSLMFLCGFWVIGALTPFSITLVTFGMLANEIHAAAHKSPKENGWLITQIQKTGFIQSQKHHAAHHRAAKDTHFCVMTNFMNPVLERIRFFRAVEYLIMTVFGIKPRFDDSVNPRFQKA